MTGRDEHRLEAQDLMNINFVDQQLLPLFEALTSLNRHAVDLISTASVEIYTRNPGEGMNRLTRSLARLFYEITSLNDEIATIARARRQMH
jgi:hypothetical protein